MTRQASWALAMAAILSARAALAQSAPIDATAAPTTPVAAAAQPANPADTPPPAAAPYPMYGGPAYWSAPPPPATQLLPADGIESEETRWYGWQTLIADGASFAVVAATAYNEDAYLAEVGVVGYVVAAPIVHAAHGRPLTGLASAGLRIGLPVAGALAGLAVADCSAEAHFCGLGEALAGLVAGIAGAIAIDAAVLAREPAPRERPPNRFALTPTLELSSRRQVLGVQGTF